MSKRRSELLSILAKYHQVGEIGVLISLLTRILTKFVILCNFLVMVTSIFIVRLVYVRREIPQTIVHSLSLGQVFRNNSSTEFKEFMCEPRLSLHQEPNTILVEIAEWRIPRSQDLEITRNIPLYLIRSCLTWKEYLHFVLFFFATSLELLSLSSGGRYSFKDLCKIQLEYSLWQSSARLSGLTYITTQSSSLRLPLCFQIENLNILKIMLWYSANNRVILRATEKSAPLRNSSDLASFIDLHLVWSRGDADWLTSNGIQRVKVVGSMVFSPRNCISQELFCSDLLYFDVTPLPRNDLFCSEAMLIKNLLALSEILKRVENISGRSLNSFLKPKRAHSKIHSKKYLDLRKQISNEGTLRTLDYDLNLYNLISGTRLVLAVPYTSPAFIALELKIPVAYLCVDVRDYKIEQEYEGIPVLRSREELESFVSKHI
jgi:polysaccharide biosynthesis PFTS motif protein